MAIVIQPYAADRVPAVRAFNERLRERGETLFQLPLSPTSRWLPAVPGEPLFEEYFLVNDGDLVRGGYVLKHQPYWINGAEAIVGCPYSPVSEGIIDPRFGRVGVQILLDALKRQPRLYGLGMGGVNGSFPKVLAAMGWTVCELPFFFRVVRPAAFLRNFRYADRWRGGRVAASLLAATGAGWLGISLANAVRTARPADPRALSWDVVPEFGGAVDAIWEAARAGCSLGAVRDRAGLTRLYPRQAASFVRIMVAREGRPIGWAVMLDTPMRGHKYFGDSRLGSVIDCLAVPGADRALDVVHAATRVMRQRRVDVIVTNQAHEDWCRAFTRAGWMSGPSNFAFAASPELAARVAPFEQHRPRFHITRADGEGPTNL